MVYTGDLKSPVERHAGSSPAPGTINCIVLEKVSVHLANALSLSSLSAGTRYELTIHENPGTPDSISV